MKVKSLKIRKTPPTLEGEVKLPREFPWKLLNAVFIDLRQYLTEEDSRMMETILRNRDVSQYLDLGEVWGLQSFTTQTYDAFVQCKARYALASLLKKFQFSGSHETRRAAALEKFKLAEQQCRSFNQIGWKELMSHEEPWIHEAIFHARVFLERLLGVTLPESSALTLWSRHGPGATLDTKNGEISKYNKYLGFPYQCTAAALRHAKALIRNDERWLGALEDQYRQLNGIPPYAILDRKAFWNAVLQVVPGAEIRFVPKNAMTYRTITIEPTLNVYLQLGVDGFVRRRLKRWAVDLDHQDRNQRLARLGSLHWDQEDPFVTLDMSMASDTISLRIVELLLPVEWYLYLLDLRSPQADCSGETTYFQKFSAMGNGFTFCLESAIFTSMIYGVMMATNGEFSREDFAVFGDDLIVRRSLSARLIQLLSSCGFKINHEKSFFEGPSRESCGTDWVRGIPVRPVFLDDVPKDVKQLFSAMNRIKRMFAIRWGMEESDTHKMMAKWVPEKYRDHTGPLSDEDFDSHLHTETCPPSLRGKGGKNLSVNCGWKYKRAAYVGLTQRGCNNLSFRKLMHSLREDIEAESSKYSPDAGTGNVFTVHRRSSVRAVRTEFSTAWKWRAEYAESLPV